MGQGDTERVRAWDAYTRVGQAGNVGGQMVVRDHDRRGLQQGYRPTKEHVLPCSIGRCWTRRPKAQAMGTLPRHVEGPDWFQMQLRAI